MFIIRDETLLKLSLISSIIGIILLFVFAQSLEAERIDIGEIDKSFIGKNVEVYATISSISESKGNYFFKLNDKTGNINAVIFKNTAASLDTARFKKGMQIVIKGKISEYEGNMEIIIDKIEFN